MSNPIPPLLCSTPPPIDFGDVNENDDDFGAFESADTEFGQFDEPSLPVTPKHPELNDSIELPVPDVLPFQHQYTDVSKQSDPSIKTESGEENIEVKNSSIHPESTTEDQKYISNHNTIVETNSLSDDNIENSIESPDLKMNEISIETDTEGQSQCEKQSRDGSPQSLQFSPEILSDDESIGDFQTNEMMKYDDNTSLPSLKFDSIDISKSTTPNFEEKSSCAKSPAEDLTTNSDDSENREYSAFEGTDKMNKENICSGDNYENLLQTDDSLSKFVDDDIQTYSNINNVECITIDNNVEKIEKDIQYDDKKHAVLANDLDNSNSSNNLNKIDSPTIDETHEIEINSNQEILFEADFSQIPISEEIQISKLPNTNVVQSESQQIEQITVNNKNSSDDDFEDFQDFTTPSNVEQKLDDNDDDFGDFSDFQDTTASTTTTLPSFIKIDDKLKVILEMMFPSGGVEDKNSTGDASSNNSDDYSTLKSNLQDIDTAKALDYQWSSSEMKHSLVKALGIDSRNILYGEKWNSSMPRFAANLGFNPLEPLKPMKVSTTSTASTSATNSSKHSSGKSSIEVPAVQFDWNSSGLVNPLDGVKEILHEGKAETLHSSKFGDSNDLGNKSTDESTSTTNQATKSITTLSDDINHDLKIESNTENVIAPINIENYAHKVEMNSEQLRPASSTTYVVPLKETHIFTPNKSENTISRNVKSGEKCPIDFDYEMAMAGTIINEQVVKKEYRDIEYNPETKMKSENLNNLDPGVNIDLGNPVVLDPNKNFRKTKSEIADNDNKITSGIFTDAFSTQSLPNPSITGNTTLEYHHIIPENSPLGNAITNANATDTLNTLQNKVKNKNDQSEQTIKQEENVEDEFSDFQSVSLPMPRETKSPFKTNADLKPRSCTDTPTFGDQMILSPAVLLPQAIKIENTEPSINWPEPGINPDELARFEEIFPQANKSSKLSSPSLYNSTATTSSLHPSNKKLSPSSSTDDDDWSDFVSVNTIQMIPTSSTTINKSNPSSKIHDDDDWSDFVSSTPMPSVNKTTSWSMGQMAPPQFNSWNQPNFYSNPLSHQQQQQQFQQHTIVPTPNLYQINNNNQFVNGYLNQMTNQSSYKKHNHQELSQQKHHQQQQQQHQQRHQTVLKSQLNKSPSISLIPDLGFVAPKPFINVPRTNFSKK